MDFSGAAGINKYKQLVIHQGWFNSLPGMHRADEQAREMAEPVAE